MTKRFEIIETDLIHRKREHEWKTYPGHEATMPFSGPGNCCIPVGQFDVVSVSTTEQQQKREKIQCLFYREPIKDPHR